MDRRMNRWMKGGRDREREGWRKGREMKEEYIEEGRVEWRRELGMKER